MTTGEDAQSAEALLRDLAVLVVDDEAHTCETFSAGVKRGRATPAPQNLELAS